MRKRLKKKLRKKLHTVFMEMLTYNREDYYVDASISNKTKGIDLIISVPSNLFRGCSQNWYYE